MRLPGTASYTLKRALWYMLTFLVAMSLTFILPRLGPVDPVQRILANINTSGMTKEDIHAIEQEYRRMFHLDKPIPEQFGIYLRQTFRGDLGYSSLQYPERNWNLIKRKLPWTLALVIPVVVLSWIAGNLLGLYAACKRGIFDRVFYPVSLFLSSVPFFCFGLILLFIFFTLLPVVDSVGAYSSDILHPEWSRSFVLDVLKHYWLPFSSIFFIMLGGQAVGMRSLALYELDTDYIVYSEALGVKESTRLRYVFRNALLPQLTGLALSLGTMIGGTLITELIFSYPGLGMMMLDAIQSQDYPLIQATAAIIAIAVLSLNFGVDLLVGCIDPRIRAAHANGGTA